MPDDRRGPVVIGLLTAFTGAVLFLAAGDVIILPDRTFGGPRWIVALFALGVFFGGGYAVSLALPVLWMRRVLGGATALAFLTAIAFLMTWLAVTGGGSRRAHPPARSGSLLFGPEVGEVVVRGFAWLFAIPLDVIALVAWVVAVRWLVRRPPP